MQNVFIKVFVKYSSPLSQIEAGVFVAEHHGIQYKCQVVPRKYFRHAFSSSSPVDSFIMLPIRVLVCVYVCV